MTNKITLILDEGTSAGGYIQQGSCTITPSLRFPDPGDSMIVGRASVTVSFSPSGPPQVQLFPCDLIGPQVSGNPGWAYTIVYSDDFPGMPRPWSFQLLSTGGNTQRLSLIAPVTLGAAVTPSIQDEVNRALAAEALLAPKASPALTGTPTAPTAPALTNNTQVATTAYADAAVLVEKSRALAAEALKASLAGAAFSGEVTVQTPVNPTDAASKAYVDSATAGQLVSGGSLALASKTVTTTYAIVDSDYLIECDASTAGFNITLPASPANGQIFVIRRIDSTTHVVKLLPNGSQNIDGISSFALPKKFDTVTVQFNGTNWDIISILNAPGVYNVRNFGAVGDGIADDTAKINAALLACHNAGGGTVLATPGLTYLISAPLVIYSNTIFVAYGATFTEAAASNCNMIKNFATTPNRSVTDAAITTGTATLTSATAAFTSADVGATVAVTNANQAAQVLTANIVSVTNGTTVVLDTNAQNTVTNAACSIYYRDSNIEIAGGTWNRNNNGYTGTGTPDQNTTQLRFIDGIYCHDMSLSCGTGKGYQMALAAVTKFVVQRITVFAPSTTANTDGVSVVGPASQGIIDTIYGSDGDDLIALHTNANQGTNSNQVVGNIFDILVTNIFPNGIGQGAVKINSSTGQTANALTVRTVHGIYTSAITFASQQPNITDLLFEDIDVVSPAASGVNLIYINCPNATTGTLTFKNVVNRAYAYTTAINMFQVAAGSNLGTLILENLTWESGTTANQSNVLQLLASVGSPTVINNILISKVTGQNTAAAWTNLVLAQQYSTIDCLTIRDVTAWTTQANDDPLFNVQGVVQTVIFDGIYLNGGGQLASIGANASAMQIIANNIVSYAAHRLLKSSASTQTDIILTNVNVNSLNQAGLINFGNTNPVVTVRGSGVLNPNNVALFNGSTPTTPPRVINLDLRVDVATIATNLGDRAYNTNAGSASLGPVIYDGAGWRSLSQPVITAADTSVVMGGTGNAPTVRTGTLDVIATQHPAAGDWSNNSHKITSLANGSAAQDAAAYGQTPAGGATVTIGQGGTGQTTQQAAIDALAGVQTSAQFLRGNGTHVVMAAIQAGDVPDLSATYDTLGTTQTITGAKTFNLPPALATQSVSGTATLSAASAPVVLTDTTSAAFTLTLPASPVTGEWFIVVDDTGQWNTHNLTIGRNGKNIDGAAANLTLVNQWGKIWLYYDGTAWWSLASGLSNETPAATGAAAAGTHNSGARADHVHPTTGLVTGVTATDTSIVIAGTAAAPTVATGTLDVIAADHPPAANWSNNSHKITSLANGSAAQDAAAYGQIPAGGATVTIGQGGTGQTARTAPVNFKPTNPTATTSQNTLVMMGLGSTCSFTPTGSGIVLITVTAYANIATGTTGIGVGARYGTGTAPTNGAALTGTRFGASGDPGVRPSGTGSGAGSAVAFTDVLSLTPATAYWFDLALFTSTTADAASLIDISVSIVELH